jgi:radical SAM superfamily enzyme YgiQ (UPF0313 family)
MRVLLINPNREQMPWPVVPVGLALVASALERAGHDVDFLDLTFARDLGHVLARRLRERPPELVAIGVRNLDNCNFEHPVFYLPEIAEQVVAVVRRHAPGVPLVVGGAAVNVCPADVLDYLGADYAVVGEGERGMPELVDALSAGRDPSSLPGVLVRRATRNALPILDTGRMGRGEPRAGRAVATDLSLWSRAHRGVDVKRYSDAGTPYPVQTKRGCALDCVYCVYNNIEGRRYRLREPSDVVDEIEEVVAHGVRHVELVDSTFNLPLAHARALCAELERRALPVELSTMGLNPAGVTDELVMAMKRAGFRSVMCTPESASETTLASLHKGFGKQAVERTARALRRAELPTWWFFLFGAPGETAETVRETLAFCEEHIAPTDVVLLAVGLRVYAGTPLELVCKKAGWFAADDPLFEPSWYLSPDVDRNELYRMLTGAAERHPNWMVNAETVLDARFAWAMKHAFRALGWRGPFWKHLPKLFRIVSGLGARQRGLRIAAERLRSVTTVRHRR